MALNPFRLNPAQPGRQSIFHHHGDHFVEAAGVAGPGWVAPIRSEGDSALGGGSDGPTEHVIDVDHYEWTHRVTTPDGEVITDIYGMCTRRAASK